MSIQTVTAGQFVALRNELAGVYQAAFSRPPWNEPPERSRRTSTGYPRSWVARTGA